MNGQAFAKVHSFVIATLMTAAVVGVWSMYGEVKELSTAMKGVVERLDRREAVIDRRIERLEEHVWPRR